MEAQDVVCRVFQPDPQKRISLAALRRHPWLTGSAPQLQPGAPPRTLSSTDELSV